MDHFDHVVVEDQVQIFGGSLLINSKVAWLGLNVENNHGFTVVSGADVWEPPMGFVYTYSSCSVTSTVNWAYRKGIRRGVWA